MNLLLPHGGAVALSTIETNDVYRVWLLPAL
jgi:hypothetical protein